MGDVIDFSSAPKPTTTDRLFQRGYRPGANLKFCTFHRFEYDPHDQTVWCSVCEKAFSGFEAFLAIAQDWENLNYSRQRLQSEVTSLLEQSDRLKKDVNNLKAQARRLGHASPLAGDPTKEEAKDG